LRHRNPNQPTKQTNKQEQVLIMYIRTPQNVKCIYSNVWSSLPPENSKSSPSAPDLHPANCCDHELPVRCCFMAGSFYRVCHRPSLSACVSTLPREPSLDVSKGHQRSVFPLDLLLNLCLDPLPLQVHEPDVVEVCCQACVHVCVCVCVCLCVCVQVLDFRMGRAFLHLSQDVCTHACKSAACMHTCTQEGYLQDVSCLSSYTMYVRASKSATCNRN
jgi:hypothetical protein